MSISIIRPGVDIYNTSMYSVNVCGCSQCWDPIECVPANLPGPHDLECICPSCLRNLDRFDEVSTVNMFYSRHPNFDDILSEIDSVTFQEVMDIAEMQTILYNSTLDLDLDNSYHPPPNSPTNQEMHAYNGNHGHQHDNGSGNFLRAAARGLRPGANAADRFAAGALAQSSLVSGGLAYSGFKDLGKPLNELREQIFGRVGPSDKDKTRNMKVQGFNLFPGDGTHISLPHMDLPKKGGKGIKQTPSVPGFKSTTGPNQPVPGFKPTTGPQQVTQTYDPVQTDMINNHLTDMDQKQRGVGRNPSSGPSNSEMHSYNGNIKPFGPITEKRHLRNLRRALKRKIKRKARVKGKVKFQRAVVKAKPLKGEKRAVNKDNKEKKIAMQYAKFLKCPSFRPPKIGSTGSNPTKLLHGYFEATYNMALPGIGGVPALANCTDLQVFLSPKMVVNGSGTTAASPVTIGFAVNGTTAFTNVASASTLASLPFNNDTALKAEAGVSGSDAPMMRYLGGHVSVICRCPMATTAPPFMYAGLLPANTASGGNFVDTSQQLCQLTSAQTRILQSTQEISGFEASSVYVPASPDQLGFTNVIAQNNVNMEVTPIPYVGMTGCPTTGTITVLCSAWYEVQQNTFNQAYSGWGLGPKLSSEDIFDYLPRIIPQQPRALPLGTRSNHGGGVSSVKAVLNLSNVKETPEEKLFKLKSEYEQLCQHINALKIEIPSSPRDDFKEEYDSDSPVYRNLTKSTIDLALSLKDKLTPGSVTSKTVRNSLP